MLIVYIGGNVEGAEIKSAVNQMSSGVATLRKKNGLRREAIAVSAANFGAIFNVNSDAASQEFNDRWDTFLSKLDDLSNHEYDCLRGLLDGVTSTV